MPFDFEPKGNPKKKKPRPINPFKKAADILKKGSKKKKKQ
jgi:hypothetical protein